MTVQELFKNLDRNVFINEYLNYCGEPKSAKRRERLKNLLDAFNNINVTPNNSWIVFCEPIVGENHLDSTIIKKEELLDTKVENGEVPEGYAYEFDCMTDILSYSVSLACIYAFGIIKVACSILYEMTFFGDTLDMQQENVKQEIKQLNRSIEEVHSSKAELVSFTDLCKKYDWTDSRKDFEKDFDTAKMLIDHESFKKLKQELCKLEISYLAEASTPRN